MSASSGTKNFKAELGAEFDAKVNPKSIKSEMQSLASYGKAYIDDNTPVRTGTLKSGNRCEYQDPYKILLENNVEYGPFVNSGTSRMKPTFFFDKTVEMISAKLESLIK